MSKSSQKSIQTTQLTSSTQQKEQSIIKRHFYIVIVGEIVYAIVKLVIISCVIGLGISINLEGLRDGEGYKRSQQNLSLWDKQIIVDMKITSGYNCPQGYQDYTQSKWPGNYPGCSCTIQVGVYVMPIVLQGSCSQRALNQGCLSVGQNPSLPFLFWKKQAHLCVKRKANFTFYTAFQDIINPNNHPKKVCGINQFHQIDMIQPIACPITNLIQGKVLQSYIPQLNISYQRQSDYPVVDFKISQHDFCQNWQQQSISPGRHKNYVLQSITKQQCSQSDPRTFFLSQQSQPQLIQNNPRIKKVIQSLPNYPPPDDHFIYKLGFLRYPTWTYHCRISQQYNLKNAHQYLTLSSIQSQLSTCRNILIICNSISFIYLVFFAIKTYLHHKNKQLQGYLYLKDYQIKKINPQSNIQNNKQCQIYKFIFVLVVSIVPIIAFGVLYQYLHNHFQWFIGAKTCTQHSFVQYLFQYQHFYGWLMVLTMTTILLNLSLPILDALFMTWRCCQGDLASDPDGQKDNKFSGRIDLKEFNITQQVLLNTMGEDGQKMISQIDYGLFEFEQQSQKSSSQYSQQSD